MLNENIPVLGLDFVPVTYISKSNQSIKIKIWDIAHQERFKTLTSAFYNYDGIIYAFNTSDLESFNNVNDWLYSEA